jgi:hypothetical protein
VFYNREDRGKDNETGLKEGGGIQININYSAPFAMLAPSLEYSPKLLSRVGIKISS